MVTETDKCRSSGSHQPPTPTTTVKNMDQHLFVQWCLEQYQKDDITPDCYRFEGAHYPLQRGMGDEKVPLTELDHGIQGIWQSEEIGRVCFFAGKTTNALNAPNYWPLGFFDAWDLCDHWLKVSASNGGTAAVEQRAGVHGKTSCEVAAYGSKGETTASKRKTGIHGLSSEDHSRHEKMGAQFDAIGGKKSFENKTSVHGRSKEQMTTDGKKGGTIGGLQGGKTSLAQRWQSLLSGHIANPCNIARHHASKGLPHRRILVWDPRWE